MFKNKRKYQYDQISKWLMQGQKISKVRLTKKLGITRATLDKLINSINSDSFTIFQRNYANNRIDDEIRDSLFNNTITFLGEINAHRQETTFIPTFKILKPYIYKENEVSLRNYQNILKKNNFYLPWCRCKTKKGM